jgi:hypothetical protein
VKRTARSNDWVAALGTGLVEPVPQPTRLAGKGTTSRVVLLFRREALLASSTERLFTLSATRAGPYRHDSFQEILENGLGTAHFPTASSVSDLVSLCEFTKEEPEDANETDMCGVGWKSEEPIRFWPQCSAAA